MAQMVTALAALITAMTGANSMDRNRPTRGHRRPRRRRYCNRR
jgi:hypothetical protein